MIYQVDKRNDYFKLPHGRHLITNNLYVLADDSFDFFHSNGRYKTKGTSLDIRPIFKANKSYLSDVLEKLNHITSHTTQEMSYGT